MNTLTPNAMATPRIPRLEDPVSAMQQFIDNPNPPTADSPYALDSLVIMAERDTGMWTVRLHQVRAEAYKLLCERQFQNGTLTGTNTLATVKYALERAANMDADVSDLQAIFQPEYEKALEEFKPTEPSVIPMEGHAPSDAKGSAPKKQLKVIC